MPPDLRIAGQGGTPWDRVSHAGCDNRVTTRTVTDVATFVTRMVVTQSDDYEPPAWEITAAPGFRVWIMEWTKTTDGRDDDYRHVEYSINSARRMTMNLLTMRPPGTSVEDVLTLIGFDEGQ